MKNQTSETQLTSILRAITDVEHASADGDAVRIGDAIEKVLTTAQRIRAARVRDRLRIALTLAKARMNAGMTQRYVAEQLGVTAPAYSRIELTGHIPAQRLEHLAQILGLDIESLTEPDLDLSKV